MVLKTFFCPWALGFFLSKDSFCHYSQSGNFIKYCCFYLLQVTDVEDRLFPPSLWTNRFIREEEIRTSRHNQNLFFEIDRYESITTKKFILNTLLQTFKGYWLEYIYIFYTSNVCGDAWSCLIVISNLNIFCSGGRRIFLDSRMGLWIYHRSEMSLSILLK